MKRTNKSVKNFQKKKYYTNRNKVKASKNSSWLDGTFSIDPLTWECHHTPKNK